MATYFKPKNPYDLKNLALLPPPPGHPIGVFYPSPDKERTFFAVGVALAVVAFLIIAGRVYLNASDKARKLAIDDVSVVLGWVCATVNVSIWIYNRQYFRRGWDLPISWFDGRFFKSTLCGQLFVALSQLFTKFAFIFLYFRIFSPSKTVRWSLYVISFVTIAYPLSIVVVYSSYCTPKLGKAWTVWNVPKCNNANLLAPIIGCFNLAIDIALFVIPMIVISNLKLSRARRLSLLAIFATGLLAVIAAVVGLAYRVIAYKDGKGGKDVNYYNFYMTLWAQVEFNCCQICSSMPAYATFSKIHIFSRFRRIRERISSGPSSRNEPAKTNIPHIETDAPQLTTLHFGSPAAAHFTGRGNLEYSGVEASRVGMSQIGNEPPTLLDPQHEDRDLEKSWGGKIEYQEKVVERSNL